MWLAQIWRYQVKSIAGERVPAAQLDEEGVAGDRMIQVYSSTGGIVTARTAWRLLGHRATLGADGPLVDGRPWDSAGVARDVEAAAGPGAHLVRRAAPQRFDVLPLLVATDGALNAMGQDWRRFRPNLVIGGVPGLAERSWEGHRLRIGNVIVGIADLRQRCVMTTFDPDTQAQDTGVLKRVYREFAGVLGLNCSVIRGGSVKEGDPVELLPVSRRVET